MIHHQWIYVRLKLSDAVNKAERRNGGSRCGIFTECLSLMFEHGVERSGRTESFLLDAK